MATIDDESFPMPTSSAVVIEAGADPNTVTIIGRGGDAGPENTADVGLWLSVTVELDRAQLDAVAPGIAVPSGGAVTYADTGATYEYSLNAEHITYLAEVGSDLVTRAHSRITCFCTRYDDQEQAISGTITVHSFDGTHLDATVDIGLAGTLPFHDAGFGGVVELDAVLSVDAPLD